MDVFRSVCIAAMLGTVVLANVAPSRVQAKSPLQIGSRLELFVDDWLIDKMDRTRLVLQRPIDAGKIFDLNLPWEGPLSGIPCVFKDGDKYRMYYRGARRMMQKGRPGSSNICYAESADGIHWTKPNLGIYEFAGAKSAFTLFLVKPYDKKPEIRTRENNITYLGDGTPQWHCFKDENPDADPQRRYKAICGITLGYGGPKGVMSSPDGLHWEWWRKEPIFVGGPMDTQNLTLWDPVSKQYMAFLRNWVSGKKGFAVAPEVDVPPKEYNNWYAEGDRVRAITLSTSKDYLHWSRQQWLIYSEGTPLEHMYTNGVTKYFRAPHIFLGFPERFVHDRVALEGWIGSAAARGKGLDDVLFMSSRDGLHWDRRFRDAFIRPGPDKWNWVDHGNMAVAPGVVQTGPGEISLYYVAHYNSDSIHLRRCTLRLDGFVSVNADYDGGGFVTKPLVFSGKQLVINYSTSAAGSVAAEIQDDSGKPLPGFALEDCPQIYGDQIDRVVAWKKGSDVSSLAGQAVRLRFVLKDADLYSIRFRDE